MCLIPVNREAATSICWNEAYRGLAGWHPFFRISREGVSPPYLGVVRRAPFRYLNFATFERSCTYADGRFKCIPKLLPFYYVSVKCIHRGNCILGRLVCVSAVRLARQEGREHPSRDLAEGRVVNDGSSPAYATA